jgi:hypothetical protein
VAEHGAGDDGRKRRKGGFARAGQIAAPIVRACGAARGFAEHRLISCWAEIAGPELAARCRPVKLNWKGPDGRGGDGLGGTLTLAVEGAFAPEVEHMAPQLIERINQTYGYRAVARIRITQAGWDGPRPAAAPPPPQSPVDVPDEALDPQVRADISGVTDPELRDRLKRLAANHAARKPRPAPFRRG